MPLAIVSQVAFNADAANSRGAMRRRSTVPAPRQVAPPPAVIAPEEAPVEDIDDDEDVSRSATGLSILAQALAAYSQN